MKFGVIINFIKNTGQLCYFQDFVIYFRKVSDRQSFRNDFAFHSPESRDVFLRSPRARAGCPTYPLTQKDHINHLTIAWK